MIAAAALTVAALTVDAALGGPLQPGSLLNSRPIFGLRWYGFGNTTFAAYATNGLLLAGYVAHRLLAAGRRRAAVIAVAAIGFGIVICQGWPSMGSDFGGVIALTPPVLWLTAGDLRGLDDLAPSCWLSAVRPCSPSARSPRWTGCADRTGAATWATSCSGSSTGTRSTWSAARRWRRPRRSPARSGIGSLIFGAAVFYLALPLRGAAAGARSSAPCARCLIALLATGILGTVLNDAGISVWLTVSILVAVTMTWFWVDQAADLRGRSADRAAGAGSVAAVADTVDNAQPDPGSGAALGRTGPEVRRVRPDPRDPRPPADLLRAGHVLGDVVRALLVQVLQGAPAPVR